MNVNPIVPANAAAAANIGPIANVAPAANVDPVVNAAVPANVRTFAAGEDEFKSFIIAPDKQLINPSMKAGRIHFDTFAKSDVKAEDKFKGCSSEIEAFRKTLKSVSTKFNVSGDLKFSHNEEDHDLASAPERTTTLELYEYNKDSIWSFDAIVSVDSATVPLHDKPKTSEVKKMKLRKKAINIRARNQIFLKIIKDLTDPNFLSTLFSKKANKMLLQWENYDIEGNTVTDGSMLLLLTHSTHESRKQWKVANPFDKRMKDGSSTGKSNDNSSASASSGEISLNEKLKSALLTRTSCTEADLAGYAGSDFERGQRQHYDYQRISSLYGYKICFHG